MGSLGESPALQASTGGTHRPCREALSSRYQWDAPLCCREAFLLGPDLRGVEKPLLAVGVHTCCSLIFEGSLLIAGQQSPSQLQYCQSVIKLPAGQLALPDRLRQVMPPRRSQPAVSTHFCLAGHPPPDLLPPTLPGHCRVQVQLLSAPFVGTVPLVFSPAR